MVRQIGDGYDPHLDAAAQTSLPKNAATVAADRADLAERRLHQSLRVLRREGAAESAPIALDALAHDAVRGFIETSGWRRLAALGAQGELGSPEALRLYALLSKPLDLEACREVATLAVAPNENAPAGPANGAAAKAVTAADVDALLEVLTSKDPSFGNLVREKLANGAGMAEVSAMLRQRREPVSPNAVPQVADDRGDRGGLTFSLSLNKWVPLDRSFDYGITLSRLFDYEVTGVVSGRTELAQRLSQLAVDPICGNALVPAEKISAFVDDLADAGRLEDPRLKALLDTPMQMVFSTTDGDKVPVSADWELP
ncbi:MAG: hypothetical protein IPJ65_19810, partial [Archangiaceae bacterium]|nr:hypothetical protein [Archangiaceae bacterium]